MACPTIVDSARINIAEFKAEVSQALRSHTLKLDDTEHFLRIADKHLLPRSTITKNYTHSLVAKQTAALHLREMFIQQKMGDFSRICEMELEWKQAVLALKGVLREIEECAAGEMDVREFLEKGREVVKDLELEIFLAAEEEKERKERKDSGNSL